MFEVGEYLLDVDTLTLVLRKTVGRYHCWSRLTGIAHQDFLPVFSPLLLDVLLLLLLLVLLLVLLLELLLLLLRGEY